MTSKAVRSAAIALVGAITLAGASARGEDHVIVQKDKSFSAPDLVVQAGDRIVFKNEDDVSHNVFSRSPDHEFEVKVQLPGQETPVTFGKPGTAEVRCAIHPNMKLRVNVEPKP
jgi:plastocyanin